VVLQKTWNNTVYNIPQSGERGWATLTNFLVALADGAQTTGKQIIGRRTAIATPVTVTSTTDCYIGVNVALAPATVNLPVGVNGQVFIIGDESGEAGTFNITLNPNGANTINGTTSYVMDLDKQVVYLVFNNGNWVVLSTGTSSAPITGVTDSATIDFTLTPGNLSAIVKLDSLDNTHINSAAGIVYTKLDLTDSVVDADIATTAAIAYVKLNLADGIVNADINSAAAIDYSKLNLSGSIVDADVNASAAIVYSKLNLAASIVDADIAVLAAIARSKIAAGTADHVVINNGSGALSSEAQLSATRGGTGVSSTATFPTSGVVVTEAGTQTLTNKTLSGAITSNYQQFTNTTVPTTPAAGSTRIYASSVDKKFHYVDDAGTDTVIGSGSGGGGGKNYLTAYSDFDTDPSTGMVTNLTATGNRASNTTVWGANTTALLSQTSTALRGTKSAQLVNGSSTANFIESPMFTLDPIDVNTNQLFISFDSNSTGSAVASGDWLVQVIRYNSSGVYQENISPSITSLPSGYYNFKCAWSHSVTATDQYSVRFKSNTAAARTLTIDTLVVGPQAVVDSAAVGGWQSYTPTITNFGTVSNLTAWYRRVGDSMEVQAFFVCGAPTAALATIGLPQTFTIDPAKINQSNTGSASPSVGDYSLNSAGSSGRLAAATATSQTSIYFTTFYSGNALVLANGSAITATGSYFTLNFRVPIAQWTSTVTLAGNPSIEYAYNTSGLTAAGASDITSFGYGSTGVAIGAINSTTLVSSETALGVRFQTPIQPTDRIVLEINTGTLANGWVPAAGTVIQSTAQYTAQIGVRIQPVGTNQVNVFFGNAGYQATNSSYGGAGASWASLTGWRWRVAKYSAVGLAELAPATATSVGTVGPGTVPGRISGAIIATGYVGQRLTATNTGVLTVGAYGNIVALDIPAGVWLIRGYIYGGGSGAQSFFSGGISTDPVNTSFSDRPNASNAGDGNDVSFPISLTSDWSGNAFRYVNRATTATYYLKGRPIGAGASVSGLLEAIRIA